LFLVAAGIFFWQLYSYSRLDTGWPHVTITTALIYLDVTWAKNPESWYGLHDFLNLIPLTIALVTVAGISGYISGKLY